MDEKKKTMIVAVLGVGLLGIGAFQFLGPKGGPAKPAAKTPPPSASGTATGTSATNATGASTVVLNPEFANPLADRDPFKETDDTTPTTPKPVQGAVPKGKTVPPLPSAGPVGPIGTGLSVNPIAPPEPVFGFRLVGVIEGKKPAAVFSDDKGVQRLVPVGASLDGDSRLVNIGHGEAVVSFRGKRLHLTPGASPDASS